MTSFKPPKAKCICLNLKDCFWTQVVLEVISPHSNREKGVYFVLFPDDTKILYSTTFWYAGLDCSDWLKNFEKRSANLRWKSVTGSVTRLGYFWKVLVANFLSKASQLSDNFFGYFDRCHYLSENYLGYFMGNFRKYSATFFRSTGHTGYWPLQNKIPKVIQQIACCKSNFIRLRIRVRKVPQFKESQI